MELYRDDLDSPVGTVTVISDGSAVRAVNFEGHEDRLARLLARHYGPVTLRTAQDPGGAVSRLSAYFEGDHRAVDALPVATGGTDFQRRVWAALRAVPPGVTASYAEIAVAVGSPAAVRAVGMANGSNPIAIVVPCHRVIGSNSSLTGYGGGLERKRWLLGHEGATFDRPRWGRSS